MLAQYGFILIERIPEGPRLEPSEDFSGVESMEEYESLDSWVHLRSFLLNRQCRGVKYVKPEKDAEEDGAEGVDAEEEEEENEALIEEEEEEEEKPLLTPASEDEGFYCFFFVLFFSSNLPK